MSKYARAVRNVKSQWIQSDVTLNCSRHVALRMSTIFNIDVYRLSPCDAVVCFVTVIVTSVCNILLFAFTCTFTSFTLQLIIVDFSAYVSLTYYNLFILVCIQNSVQNIEYFTTNYGMVCLFFLNFYCCSLVELLNIP